MADNDLNDYRAMKDWLAGTKPPAQGRTWRRRLQAIMPASIDTPLRQTLPGVAVDILELGGLTLASVLPMVVGLGLISAGGHLLSLLESAAPAGASLRPVDALARELFTFARTIAGLSAVVGGILLALRMVFLR
jgi:hypothetical protein